MVHGKDPLLEDIGINAAVCRNNVSGRLRKYCEHNVEFMGKRLHNSNSQVSFVDYHLDLIMDEEFVNFLIRLLKSERIEVHWLSS